MSTNIKPETIEFLNRAKKFFDQSLDHVSFRDEDVGLIALRYGLDDNCILLFELGNEIAFFEDWMDRTTTEEKIKHHEEKIEKLKKVL